MSGFDDLEMREADYVANKKPDKLYVSDFTNGNGKIISTIVDENSDDGIILLKAARSQVSATYIANTDKVVAIKIVKFKIKSGQLVDPVEIRLDTNSTEALARFLQFLSSANLKSFSSGRLSFEENIALDADLDSKLRVLASDEKGKSHLMKLLEEGYLTADMDIPELIKKGLSKDKIEEKRDELEKFKALILRSDIKEVSDIQAWLKSNPWVFGPEYKQYDFRNAGDAGNPDGRLLRIDGLSDILEVKLPNVELLRQDLTGRQFISPPLAEALGQLTGYLEYYYSAYSQERDDITADEILNDRYGKYYKPKGILLIGRRKKVDLTNGTAKTIDAHPKYLRRLLSYYHWVEVLTFDDLIERAENSLINLIK